MTTTESSEETLAASDNGELPTGSRSPDDALRALRAENVVLRSGLNFYRLALVVIVLLGGFIFYQITYGH